ncbi:MAG: ABC transporter ATP-binding protein [Pseudomonadota bacterium]
MDAVNAILRVEGMRKSFGALRAVDDVSFVLNEREILGVAGPNGSGKSTLFNLLTRIQVQADAGTVWFDGKDISGVSANKICQLGIARTFQRDADFATMTALDNAIVGAAYGKNAGTSKQANKDRAISALRRVGLDPSCDQMPAETLSSFQRRCLMIATALATDPAVLLLDEPASGLTPPEIAQLGNLIQSLREEGMSVVLIEHVLSLLLDVSDRLIVLDHGQVIAEGNPDDVVRSEAVIEAYLGPRHSEVRAHA